MTPFVLVSWYSNLRYTQTCLFSLSLRGIQLSSVTSNQEQERIVTIGHTNVSISTQVTDGKIKRYPKETVSRPKVVYSLHFQFTTYIYCRLYTGSHIGTVISHTPIPLISTKKRGCTKVLTVPMITEGRTISNHQIS